MAAYDTADSKKLYNKNVVDSRYLIVMYTFYFAVYQYSKLCSLYSFYCIM